MQLTLIPGLSRGGAKRLHIEAVRVAASARGGGLGSALFDWAHAYGRSRGATLAQLTSDKSRSGAHRFYEKLGYRASHEGFKYQL
jgi:GNAT superfamily N-acetyltransferase